MSEPHDCPWCGVRHRIGENTLCPVTIRIREIEQITECVQVGNSRLQAENAELREALKSLRENNNPVTANRILDGLSESERKRIAAIESENAEQKKELARQIMCSECGFTWVPRNPETEACRRCENTDLRARLERVRELLGRWRGSARPTCTCAHCECAREAEAALNPQPEDES